MSQPSALFDRILRPLGATIIIVFAAAMILLSFWLREAKQGRNSWTDRLLFSSSFVENWFHDLRSRRFLSKKLSPNLVVLEITDESLARVGRWPWTRPKHAKIVDALKAYGATSVMFDAFFPEPESAAADGAFAKAIQRFNGNDERTLVLGYGLTDHEEDALPLPDALQLSAISGTGGKDGMPSPQFVDKLAFNAPALHLFEARYGFIAAKADPDGVFRHAQIVNWVDGTLFPSLGLAGFIGYYSDGKEKKVVAEALNQGQGFVLRILSEKGERRLLLSPRGEVKLRYHSGPIGFQRVPIHEVYEDPAPEKNASMQALFKGKAVLIGSSAVGAHDLRHTPVDPELPGMYTHANIFHALDQDRFYRSDDASLFFSLILFVLGVVGMILLTRLGSPMHEALGAITLVFAIFAADHWYLNPSGYFVRLFFCLFGVIALHAWFTILNVFEEGREKKKIRDAFSRYVAPEIVKEMLSNPDKLKVGGEKKEITMLFSDVRDFTTISEKLSPQDLAALLNIYMGKMTDILFDTGGTLDKYIGDAMVGFWGAPLDIKDHAYQAVKGALQMLEALPPINKEFARRKFPQINVGIGLNTGEVNVGNMGSDKIFQYTALGDNMNLASRLESLTKHYGVNLMISQFTYEKLGDKRSEFMLRPLDLVQVKGKSQAVKIYEVIPSFNPWAQHKDELEQYRAAYEDLYLHKHFAEAEIAFSRLLEILPDDKNVAKLLSMTRQWIQDPPPDNWDGVTVFTSK